MDKLDLGRICYYCYYYCTVMTIELANIALSLIQEKENQYDLVIAEVDMPEMDGFTFLKHILCERDIPIICKFTHNLFEIDD